MKHILFTFLLSPLSLWAQIDNLSPVRPNALKPIESDLLPAYYGRYGAHVRTQYVYDGLDVRHAKDLGQYIMASGDPNAIREFNAYLSNRRTGGWLIAGGIVTAVVGVAIMGSNGPGSDGKFTMQQPYICPTGYACGGSSGGMVYGGQIAGYTTVTDTQRQNAYGAGGAMLLGGAILAGIGGGMNLPGSHLRRSVQYYNRALKQRGISWQLAPYSSQLYTGVGLVGQF